MESEVIKSNLQARCAAPLKDFYTRRIIFWYDEEREFEPMLDELSLPGVKLLKLTGRNSFAAKLLSLRERELFSSSLSSVMLEYD